MLDGSAGGTVACVAVVALCNLRFVGRCLRAAAFNGEVEDVVSDVMEPGDGDQDFKRSGQCAGRGPKVAR